MILNECNADRRGARHNGFEITRTEDRKMQAGSDDRDIVSVALINLNTSETVIKEMMT